MASGATARAARTRTRVGYSARRARRATLVSSPGARRRCPTASLAGLGDPDAQARAGARERRGGARARRRPAWATSCGRGCTSPTATRSTRRRAPRRGVRRRPPGDRAVVVAGLLDPRMLVEVEADAYVAAGGAASGSRSRSGVRVRPARRAACPASVPAAPPPSFPLAAAGVAGAGARGDGAHGDRGAVPRRRRARRGEDPPGARASPASCCARGAVRRVAVVCPTAPLTRQWAAAAGAARRAPRRPTRRELRPPRDFDGVAVTYARVATVAERVGAPVLGRARSSSPTRRTTSARTSPGAQGSRRAFARAGALAAAVGHAVPLRRRRRSRACATSDGVAVPDVSYTYADAVRDGICRPVTFIPYDGVAAVAAAARTSSRPRSPTRSTGREASAPLPDGDLASSSPTACRGSSRRRTRSCRHVRAGGHRDAGGLVVAADGEHARAVAKVLRAVTGAPPVVVLHTEARAAEKLAAFTRSREPLDRRGEHGLRGRRHPAAARRRLRDGGQDAADLPPDRRALRPHDPGPPGST